LLWALEEGLGSAFTPEVKDAWIATYNIIADAMKRAAAEVPAEAAIIGFPRRSGLPRSRRGKSNLHGGPVVSVIEMISWPG
jgi:hypothetical protein